MRGDDAFGTEVRAGSSKVCCLLPLRIRTDLRERAYVQAVTDPGIRMGEAEPRRKQPSGGQFSRVP